MVYLIVLALVASVAIGRLWLLQHRQRAHIQTVDGFRASLARLSDAGRPGFGHHEPSPKRRPATRVRTSGPARPAPLDPTRREAAKRRIAARRASRARAAS